MSPSGGQGNNGRITKDDIPDLVYEALTDRFSNQDRRQRGCFLSQSFREVMRFVSPEQVQRITAARTITNHTQKIPLSGGLSDCLSAKVPEGMQVELRYDRSDAGIPFGKYYDDIRRWLDRYDDVYDIPISELVIRIDSEPLRDQLLTVLKDSIGFADAGEFTTPFYAVMRSKAPGKALSRSVREHHSGLPREYFKKNTDSSKRGLGWKLRTLDLMALWSYRAYTKSGTAPMTDDGEPLTMHDIEDLAINNVETDRQVYGAINSPLVINKWRRVFSNGTTDEKRWQWGDTNGWVRTR